MVLNNTSLHFSSTALYCTPWYRLSRVVVDEDTIEKKKRERLEELREAEEKRQWEEFRLAHVKTG